MLLCVCASQLLHPLIYPRALDCFPLLAIVNNNAAMNIGVQVFFHISVFGFSRPPEVLLLGCMAVLHLTFWGTPCCFPWGLLQFAIPPTVREGSFYSTSSPALVIYLYFNDSHPGRWEVVSHCGFNLHVPDGCDAQHLFICLSAISLSSWEKCLFRSSAHFLIELFVWCSGIWVLYVFWMLTPYQRYNLWISSLVQELAFIFIVVVDDFLCYAESFLFQLVPFDYFCFCCPCLRIHYFCYNIMSLFIKKWEKIKNTWTLYFTSGKICPRRHIRKDTAKTNVREFIAHVFCKNVYGFRSYMSVFKPLWV